MIWGGCFPLFSECHPYEWKTWGNSQWIFLRTKSPMPWDHRRKTACQKGMDFVETPKIQHHNLPKGCFRKNAVAAKTEHTSNLSIKTHRRFGENKGFDPTVEGFGDKKGEANQPRFKFSSGTLMYLFNTTKV